MIDAIALGHHNGFPEVVQTVDPFDRSRHHAHHVIAQLGDGRRTVAVQDIRRAVIIGKNRRIDGLPHSHTLHRTRNDGVFGRLVWAGRRIRYRHANRRFTALKLGAVVEVILAILFLDGRRPCGSDRPRRNCRILVAIRGRLVILIHVEDHSFVGPVDQVGRAESMEVIPTPSREAISRRENPEFSVEIIDIRIGILPRQNRII